MIHALWISLLVLLIASWVIFIRYRRALGRRESQAFKKIEDVRRGVAEQTSGLDVFIDLLAGLHEFVSENAGAEALPAVYKMILDAACLLMKCPAGSLMVPSAEGDAIEIVCQKGLPALAAGLPKEITGRRSLQQGQGVAGRAAESGKMIVVDDIETDARFVGRKDMEAHLRSLVSVPMKVKQKVVGVLNVDAPEAHHVFGERDLRLLSAFANLAALALENLKLYNNLQLYYQQMVQTLAETLEYREFDPKGRAPADHSRIRRLARAAAQELKLPESIVKYIEYACLMHGIGKIGIGEAILRKPGKLTAEEYEQIKKHPEIAQQMISKVQFLSPIVPMILYHQERWDGGGYPAGLKGEEIPLGSRIVAVVNAFDAMVSEKPYRRPLSENQAMDELKRGAGTQFDPKVVQAFINVMERGKAGR